ncbi:unnamed protein product [Rotaria sordida]|uniref:Uncharacterized protein n=2 Tax=Rotaria sordida TaxID=392033 RepID=A0A819E013_9BILA|nr:unnamed protein product [Rotaria sordida]CAF3842377.1 unnamed protein product [Rotaria sordida]
MYKSTIRQFPLTPYEADLFHHINIFHSNGILAKKNQLDYSRLESASITPFTSFLKFYQLICSTPQLINSNQFWISSHLSSPYDNSITDAEKQVIDNVYKSSLLTQKDVKSRTAESNNSFCRQIVFHGQEILSYCTTSSTNLKEKDNQTILCVSIKDIVSIYFPWSSIEQFIQICRRKQITRFKPDKSTGCDSTLRLVNMQELENHWNFILKELLPDTQISSNKHSNQSEKDKLSVEFQENNLSLTNNSNDSLSSNINNQDSTKTLGLSFKENLSETSSAEVDNSMENNNENRHLLNNSYIESNDNINKSYQSIEQDNNENQFEMNVLEDKQEKQTLSTINKKVSKGNQHRSTISYNYSKRRKQQLKRSNHHNKCSKHQLLKQYSNDVDQQLWMKKYSIESFSIIIDRYKLPCI